MPLSNSAILLSENDLNPIEFTFLLRPTFQTDTYLTVNSESKSQSDLSSSEVEDDDNGFRTPTSLDRKIPSVLRCPLAPRKPKSRPMTKRKTYRRQQLLVDLSNEIQSLFPPEFLAGLGGKIKRVRPAAVRE